MLDSRVKKPVFAAAIMNNEEVEVVSSFRYLGTVVDCKLNFDEHVHAVYKKAQQRLYLLRKLRSFGVSSHVLQNVYRSLIESIISFNAVSWAGNLSVENKSKLNRIINTASKIVGGQQLQLSVLYQTALRRKACCILEDNTHPLHSRFQRLPSGRRFRVPLAKKLVHKRSFVPSAISILNAK